MATRQPTWKLLANLGDVNPVDYGGYFVYEDTTGVYAPQAELLESPDSDDAPEGWTIHRFDLDRCTYINGVLSDNKFHPELSAWWAQSPAEAIARPQDSNLAQVASCIGSTEAELIEAFCSEDPLERAWAYRAIGEYHGFDNLDSYPLHLTDRAEVEARYAHMEVAP